MNTINFIIDYFGILFYVIKYIYFFNKKKMQRAHFHNFDINFNIKMYAFCKYIDMYIYF